MDVSQFMGLIRHALTVAAGWFIARGYIDESGGNEIIGGAMAILGAGWSYLAKNPNVPIK